MEELVRQLLELRLIAKLATLKKDGAPHIVAVWFDWDGSSVFVPTNHDTQKIRNLKRDDRASILVDVAAGGFEVRGVSLSGRAEIVGPPESLSINRRIHRKYITDDALSVSAVRRYLDTDDVTIKFSPERSVAWDQAVTPYGIALRKSGGYRPLDG